VVLHGESHVLLAVLTTGCPVETFSAHSDVAAVVVWTTLGVQLPEDFDPQRLAVVAGNHQLVAERENRALARAHVHVGLSSPRALAVHVREVLQSHGYLNLQNLATQ
jgi:hypothetical protein